MNKTPEQELIEDIKTKLRIGWDGASITNMLMYQQEIMTYYACLTEMAIDSKQALAEAEDDFVFAYRKRPKNEGLKQFEYKQELLMHTRKQAQHLEELEGLIKVISKQSAALITSISTEKELAKFSGCAV